MRSTDSRSSCIHDSCWCKRIFVWPTLHGNRQTCPMSSWHMDEEWDDGDLLLAPWLMTFRDMAMAARLAVRCAAIASPGIWLMAVYCSEWVASQPSRIAVMEWPKMTGNPNIKWPAVAQTSRHCIRRGIYHRNVEWNDWNVWYAQHLPLCRPTSAFVMPLASMISGCCLNWVSLPLFRLPPRLPRSMTAALVFFFWFTWSIVCR